MLVLVKIIFMSYLTFEALSISEPSDNNNNNSRDHHYHHCNDNNIDNNNLH